MSDDNMKSISTISDDIETIFKIISVVRYLSESNVWGNTWSIHYDVFVNECKIIF